MYLREILILNEYLTDHMTPNSQQPGGKSFYWNEHKTKQLKYEYGEYLSWTHDLCLVRKTEVFSHVTFICPHPFHDSFFAVEKLSWGDKRTKLAASAHFDTSTNAHFVLFEVWSGAWWDNPAAFPRRSWTELPVWGADGERHHLHPLRRRVRAAARRTSANCRRTRPQATHDGTRFLLKLRRDIRVVFSLFPHCLNLDGRSPAWSGGGGGAQRPAGRPEQKPNYRYVWESTRLIILWWAEHFPGSNNGHLLLKLWSFGVKLDPINGPDLMRFVPAAEVSLIII